MLLLSKKNKCHFLGYDLEEKEGDHMAKKLEVCITDPVGLYAKPVTKLVEMMKLFDCYVHLRYGEKDTNMKSMMGLLSLGIPCKAHVTIIAEGKDEDHAIATLKDKIYDMHLGHVL